MNKNAKKLALAMLATTTAIILSPAASAQVAGMAAVDKLAVIMGSKAFKDGYNTVATQQAEQINRLDQLNNELEPLSKPYDSDGDGQLTEKDQAWINALKERDAIIASLDKNKDKNLTGTELDEFRAKNLPAQQIIDKRREIGAITENIQLQQLFVIDTINKQYGPALKSVVTAKKINAVFAPGVFAWAPKEIDIGKDVIAALDRAVPAVQLPAPDKFSTSEDAVNLHGQIKELIIQNAVAQLQAAQAQQQQGGAPPSGQPAAPATGPAPTPPKPGNDPNADNGTGG